MASELTHYPKLGRVQVIKQTNFVLRSIKIEEIFVSFKFFKKLIYFLQFQSQSLPVIIQTIAVTLPHHPVDGKQLGDRSLSQSKALTEAVDHVCLWTYSTPERNVCLGKS